MMSDNEFHLPEIDPARLTSLRMRGEELLQRFFEQTVSDDEADELLEIWDRLPRLEEDQIREYRTEQHLRFLGTIDRNPLSFDVDRERILALPGVSPNAAPADEGQIEGKPPVLESISWDEVVDLARQSDSIEKDAIATAAIAGSNREPIPYTPIKFRWTTYISPALLLVVFFGAVYREFFPGKKVDSSSTIVSRSTNPDTRKPIAVLSACIDAVFENESIGRSLGRPMDSSNYRLKSGTAEFLFYNGTRLVVEGPADLTFLAPMQIFCTEGTLSATVPVSGHGFEITTPFSTVRDLGTRFIAHVGTEGCGVHVVEGKVEMQKKGEPARLLTAGRSFGMGPGFTHPTENSASSNPLLPDSSGFVSPEQVREMVRRIALDNFPDRGTAANASAPPRILFDPNTQSKGVLRRGGRWVEGEMPDRKALRFALRNDRIEISDVEPLNSLTIVARLRLDRLDPDCNPLLMSTGVRQGGILWQILPSGELSFGFRSRDDQRTTVFNTPIVMTESNRERWITLAVVVDKQRKTITQYLDGGIIASESYNAAPSYQLAGANIGNWILSENPIRQLTGEIEYLSVFDRPLHGGEIDRIHLSFLSETD